MARNEPSSTSEQTSLLPSHLRDADHAGSHHIINQSPNADDQSYISRARSFLRWFLSCKWGHYFVIVLVSLDIACIFADFIVSLHVCEHGRDKGFDVKSWLTAENVLGAFSLAFSTLFMLELLASVFAFGFRYFTSAFHVLDATVIVASFIIDVALRGGLEEAGSLIIVLRLWRVFKIIEEFSTGADEQMAGLREHIEKLEKENDLATRETQSLKIQLERVQGAG